MNEADSFCKYLLLKLPFKISIEALRLTKITEFVGRLLVQTEHFHLPNWKSTKNTKIKRNTIMVCKYI